MGLAEGSGSEAKFNAPNGLDVDRDGNLYVADAGNHRIRKVTPQGVVSTLAGSTSGYLDGTGVAAQFNSPYGVAVGGDGAVYVADTGNNRIRRISATGDVSTMAGSGIEGFKDDIGTSAQFRQPFSLTSDEPGNLYVADAGNHAIRRVTPAGNVTTVAGSTPGRVDGPLSGARFFVPNDVAFDPARRLYTADFNNHAVRRMDLGLQVVVTIAGNGSVGAADAVGEAARFNFPTGIAVDGQSRVYVADNQNHRIRLISADGSVTTLCGTTVGLKEGSAGQAQFNEPTDLVLSQSGALYIADTQNHRIRVYR